MTSIKKKGFFNNIKSLYRFQIIDINTYDVKWVREISKLNMIVIGWVGFLVLLAFAFLIFALTPLKYLLPGYVGTNASEKRELIELRLKTDQLENKLSVENEYFTNLRNVLNDSIGFHEDYSSEIEKVKTDSTYLFPNPSNLELQYRKEFEELLNTDKSEQKGKNLFVLNQMHHPVEGKPVMNSDNDKNSKTLRIKSHSDATIFAVLEGVVIANYTTDKEKHIFILHDNNLLSVYKFGGESKVVVGERVAMGQWIGILSEKGDHILSIDMWENMEPIAIGQFLKF